MDRWPQHVCSDSDDDADKDQSTARGERGQSSSVFTRTTCCPISTSTTNGRKQDKRQQKASRKWSLWAGCESDNSHTGSSCTDGPVYGAETPGTLRVTCHVCQSLSSSQYAQRRTLA